MKRHRWCVPVRRIKANEAALSSATYSAPPYILMNYKEDVFADVFTWLMSRALDAFVVRKIEPQRWAGCGLPYFAEVASTFNEGVIDASFAGFHRTIRRCALI